MEIKKKILVQVDDIGIFFIILIKCEKKDV